MKMNILHIVDSLTIGGVQKNLLSIIRHTDHGKIKHFIAYTGGGALEAEFKNYDVQLYKIQNRHLRFRDFYGPSILYKLINYVKSNNIDIVHTHLFVPYFFGTLTAKFCGIPIVNHVNTEEYRKQARAERLLKGNIVSSHPILNRILMRHTDMTIAITLNTQDELSRLANNKDKVKLVYNGIDIPGKQNYQIENIKRTYGLNAKHYVCSIGRLCKQKNQMLLIKAVPFIVKKIPDVQFIIVGDGPMMEDLKAAAKELKLDKSIIFTGALLDIHPILDLADIFVLSSVWEQHPISILEAMSMRKPVVAPRIAAIPETVIDGESGILFEPNNVDQLANAILTLLKDEKRANLMGMRGYQIIEEQFINEKQVKKIEDVYLSFAKNRIDKNECC